MSSSQINESPWAYYKSSDVSNQTGGDRFDSHGGQSSGRPQRKKLELKPRTVSSKVSPQSSASQSSAPQSSSGKSNPFGAAKPREEVLASKGIDSKLVDLKFQKKASIVHFTKAQEAELDVIRRELKTAENQWREANEMELPEEKFRVLTEEKRKELKELMDKFELENSKKEDLSSLSDRTKTYQRPSERRKQRSEQDHNTNDNSRMGGSGYYDNFHGRRGDYNNNGNRGNNSYQSRNYGNRDYYDNRDDAYASFGKGRNNNRRKGSGDYGNHVQSF